MGKCVLGTIVVDGDGMEWEILAEGSDHRGEFYGLYSDELGRYKRVLAESLLVNYEVVMDAGDGEFDPFNSDAEADADVLASAGWGTDEDYGYYGDDF
jgi:hypothetical protein